MIYLDVESGRFSPIRRNIAVRLGAVADARSCRWTKKGVADQAMLRRKQDMRRVTGETGAADYRESRCVP